MVPIEIWLTKVDRYFMSSDPRIMPYECQGQVYWVTLPCHLNSRNYKKTTTIVGL